MSKAATQPPSSDQCPRICCACFYLRSGRPRHYAAHRAAWCKVFGRASGPQARRACLQLESADWPAPQAAAAPVLRPCFGPPRSCNSALEHTHEQTDLPREYERSQRVPRSTPGLSSVKNRTLADAVWRWRRAARRCGWATVPRPSWVATATYATFAMLQCDAGPMGKVVCLRHAQS